MVEGWDCLKVLLLGDIFAETDVDANPKADVVIGNLEGPIGGTKVYPLTRMPKVNRFALRSNPRVIRRLGLSMVSLANNHIWDYGKEGYDDTISFLEKENIVNTGAMYERPKHLYKDGVWINLFAYSWHIWPATVSMHREGVGANDIRRDVIKKDLSETHRGLNIVYLHWGFERETHPMPSQQRLARDIIDWGADIVVGSHPHVIQGMEVYKKGLILYSLGNFVFKFKNKKNPYPEESIGVLLDTNDVRKYEVVVFKGNKNIINQKLSSYNKQLASKDYSKIWKNERTRKNLPGIAFGVKYEDTFDVF